MHIQWAVTRCFTLWRIHVYQCACVHDLTCSQEAYGWDGVFQNSGWGPAWECLICLPLWVTPIQSKYIRVHVQFFKTITHPIRKCSTKAIIINEELIHCYAWMITCPSGAWFRVNSHWKYYKGRLSDLVRWIIQCTPFRILADTGFCCFFSPANMFLSYSPNTRYEETSYWDALYG